jgi:hypothetical protein
LEKKKKFKDWKKQIESWKTRPALVRESSVSRPHSSGTRPPLVRSRPRVVLGVVQHRPSSRPRILTSTDGDSSDFSKQLSDRGQQLQ